MPKNIIEIINAIKKLEGYRFDRQVAEQMGIDGRTLATYKSRGDLPHHFLDQFRKKYNIRPNQLDSFLKNIDNYNNLTNKQNTTGTDIMNRQEGLMGRNQNNEQQLIDLQKEKIERLEKKILQNKEANKESELEIDFHFHMNCSFVYKLSSLSVDIMYEEPCSNFEYICGKLGYTEEILKNDIFSFNKMLPYSKHTIHQLRTIDDKKKMKDKAMGIIKSFSYAKNEIAKYCLEIPVVYRHKNGKKVRVVNQYLVDWHNKTAEVNISFINEDA